MLIALLALLGINLIVIVLLLASVLSRKRWVKRRPGSFRGVLRVSGGEVEVAAQDDESELLLGPYGRHVDAAVVAEPTPVSQD